MTHLAILETYPQVKAINGDYPNITCYDDKGNILNLDLSLVPDKSQLEILQDSKQNGEIYSLNGIDYKVPFMKDDGDALMQVKAAFDFGETSTKIKFTNGTIMPITSVDFMSFAAWFVTKRNKFFT